MMATWATLLCSVVATGLAPDDAVIAVDAGKVLHRVSPLLYGACIEDVNHEIYGGIYSQMVFGESFQEPPAAAIKGGATSEAPAGRAVDPLAPGGVSGMWRALRRGSAAGGYALETDRPFAGSQGQRITFE